MQLIKQINCIWLSALLTVGAGGSNQQQKVLTLNNGLWGEQCLHCLSWFSFPLNISSDTVQGSALCPTLLGEDAESRVLTHKIIWLCKNNQAKFQLYNMTLQYIYTFWSYIGRSLLADGLGQVTWIDGNGWRPQGDSELLLQKMFTYFSLSTQQHTYFAIFETFRRGPSQCRGGRGEWGVGGQRWASGQQWAGEGVGCRDGLIHLGEDS